jgi:hypothetical protein
MYPKELDYEEIQPLPSNWLRVDGFVRTTKDTFTLPECLSNRSGKLIFLSMGSFGCANLELMTRVPRQFSATNSAHDNSAPTFQRNDNSAPRQFSALEKGSR